MEMVRDTGLGNAKLTLRAGPEPFLQIVPLHLPPFLLSSLCFSKIKVRWWLCEAHNWNHFLSQYGDKWFPQKHSSTNCPQEHNLLGFFFFSSHLRESLWLSVKLKNRNVQKQHIYQIITTWKVRHSPTHAHSQGEGEITCLAFVLAERQLGPGDSLHLPCWKKV
jgi:hypothetical protein